MLNLYRCFFLFLMSLISYASFSQKEASVWFLGTNNTLNFNTSPIQSIYNTKFNNNNFSAASICNNKGELLFYTDGYYVYDSSNKVIENGFGLNNDGACLADKMVIIPAGTSEKKYYIVSVHSEMVPYINKCSPKYDTTFTYSTVEWNKNTKQYKVVQKNILLRNSVKNALASTLHVNGIDTWVVVSDYKTGKLISYLFSECGVIKVIENKLIDDLKNHIPSPDSDAYLSDLLFSPNGDFLVYLVAFNRYKLSFDNTSGLITYLDKFNFPIWPNGMCFSPNSKFLFSQWYDGRINLGRYDLINNSIEKLSFDINDTFFYPNLSLGLDGRIYFYQGVHTYTSTEPNIEKTGILGVYQNTEDLFTKNNLILNQFDVRTKFDNDLDISFPHFISNYFDPDYAKVSEQKGVPFIRANTRVCEQDAVVFDVDKVLGVTEYYWNFGDGNVITSIKNPIHQYEQSGRYNVELVLKYTCNYDTLNFDIVVDESTAPLFYQDTLFSCQNVVLDAGYNYYKFNWSTGESTQFITVNSEGVYHVNLENSCGNYETNYIIKKPNPELYNLITPNNDGKNDVLYFKELPNLGSNISVYNSWGSKVYENTNYKNVWGGSDLSKGIYYYEFNYEGCPTKTSWVDIR
jgi:hypothetical protein